MEFFTGLEINILHVLQDAGIEDNEEMMGALDSLIEKLDVDMDDSENGVQ